MHLNHLKSLKLLQWLQWLRPQSPVARWVLLKPLVLQHSPCKRKYDLFASTALEQVQSHHVQMRWMEVTASEHILQKSGQLCNLSSGSPSTSWALHWRNHTMPRWFIASSGWLTSQNHLGSSDKYSTTYILLMWRLRDTSHDTSMCRNLNKLFKIIQNTIYSGSCIHSLTIQGYWLLLPSCSKLQPIVMLECTTRSSGFSIITHDLEGPSTLLALCFLSTLHHFLANNARTYPRV